MKEFLKELDDSKNEVHDTQMVMRRLAEIGGEYARRVMDSEFDLTGPENEKLNILCDAINHTIIRISETKIIGHYVLKEILLTKLVDELVN